MLPFLCKLFSYFLNTMNTKVKIKLKGFFLEISPSICSSNIFSSIFHFWLRINSKIFTDNRFVQLNWFLGISFAVMYQNYIKIHRLGILQPIFLFKEKSLYFSCLVCDITPSHSYHFTSCDKGGHNHIRIYTELFLFCRKQFQPRCYVR